MKTFYKINFTLLQVTLERHLFFFMSLTPKNRLCLNNKFSFEFLNSPVINNGIKISRCYYKNKNGYFHGHKSSLKIPQ